MRNILAIIILFSTLISCGGGTSTSGSSDTIATGNDTQTNTCKTKKYTKGVQELFEEIQKEVENQDATFDDFKKGMITQKVLTNSDESIREALHNTFGHDYFKIFATQIEFEKALLKLKCRKLSI